MLEKVYEKMFYAKLWLKAQAYDFLHDEDGAVDIVAIVLLIGIVVVLAIVFRKAIVTLIKDLLSKIFGDAETAVELEP